MTKKRWFSLTIVAVVVIGSLGLIKLFPFWVTLACLVSLVAGFVAGYLFKKDVVKVVEKVVEVIKEIPSKKSSKKPKKE